jgi:hypothetical protein
MSARKKISKSLRFKIFHRDGFVCQYCGRRPPDIVLELDHIHPHSQGGDDSEINLITSCDECNRGKSDRVLSRRAIRPDADIQFLEAQQEIAEARRFLQAQAERDALRDELIAALERLWDIAFPGNKCPYRNEFARLLESYHVTEIAEAMKIAGRRHARQYIGYQDQIVSYIWGILRSRERERGE